MIFFIINSEPRASFTHFFFRFNLHIFYQLSTFFSDRYSSTYFRYSLFALFGAQFSFLLSTLLLMVFSGGSREAMWVDWYAKGREFHLRDWNWNWGVGWI